MFDAMIAGRNGVAPISHFQATTFPTTFAAEVKDFHLERFVPRCERWASAGPNSSFAAAAAQQALSDAGALEAPGLKRTRFGIYLGSGEGVQDFDNLMILLAESYDPKTRKLDFPTF